MCFGSGSSTSTSTSNPNPTVAANYDYITGRARSVADIPFEYYPGNLVAPISGQTRSGFDIINQSQGVAAPFISRASQFAESGAAPIGGAQIGAYLNPYHQQVIDATAANIDEMNARQQQDVIGNAIVKGAWGGDRAGVAQAELARQQGLAAGQTFAGLNAQNYSQALAAAQQDAQRQAQAAYTMGALGQEAQSTALQGANAQIAAGQLQQQQAQNEINSAYGQFQQAKQYPFNTTQWLAGVLGGQAGQMGGTSTTTQPAPGFAQQAIGAGAGIAGILGATGAFGSTGWLWSDERLKENIEPIGRAFDGQMIYRYNFKGDPATQIGFLAQEVERIHPDAARTIDGIKGVDYHEATEDAAARGGFAAGGIPTLRSPIMPGIDSYTPDTDSPAAGPLVLQGYELKSITKPAYEQASRGFAPGGSVLVDPGRRERQILRWLEQFRSANPQMAAEPAPYAAVPTAPPRPLPDISDREGLLRALGNHLLDDIGRGDPRVVVPGDDAPMWPAGGYDAGGVVPYGETETFPTLGAVNGVPVPVAAVHPSMFRMPSPRARGPGIPAAPKPSGGSSDIGADVIRLASALRAAGLGKRSMAQPTDAGRWAKGGKVRPGLANGGDPEEDRWSPPVTVRMPGLAGPQPVVTMAMPTPIPLPEPVERAGVAPSIVIPPIEPADRLPPPMGVVAALDALRDDVEAAPPRGVAVAPAPSVVAAAPPATGRAFPSDYAARISRVEGRTADATNPHTGAAGFYQFMPATAHGLAQGTAWGRGMSPAQIMAAIKADPAKQDELLGLYNQHSTAALSRAGIPANDATMFALHAFGPAGGVSLLRAPDDMPVIDWVRSVRWDNGATPKQVIAQNNLGKYRTVGELRRGFIEQRIGGPSPSGVVVAGRGTDDDSGDGAGDGGDTAGGAPGVAGRAPAGGVAPPPDDGGDETPKSDRDDAQDFMLNPWLALAAAGFGMAASQSPHFGVALGQGGLQGVQTALAQGKMKREIQQAKAMEEHRKATLGLSREAAERQARILEKNLVKDERLEAARQRAADQAERRMAEAERRNAEAEKARLRVIERQEGREAREAEEGRLARVRFNPDKDKPIDAYTGFPVLRNMEGEERLRLPDGRLVTREEADKVASGGHDRRVERKVTLPAGDMTIPAMDPDELRLDKKLLDAANKRYEDILKSSSGAGDVQRQLNDLKRAYANLPATGAMSPGAWAETWRNVARQANALSATLGTKPVFDPDKVGSLDEMGKLTAQLAATATKAFNGSRPTNFDFEQMLRATPGAQLGPEAFTRIVAAMEAQNNRARDLGRYAAEYIKHRRTAYGLENEFSRQRPDDFYFRQAGAGHVPGGPAAATPSPGATLRISTEDEYNALPKGSTYIDARDGKTKTKR